MTTRITRVLTELEYDDMQTYCRNMNYWHSDRRVFVPGLAWYQPWYFDHTGERQRKGQYVMLNRTMDEAKGRSFLSPHYWSDWSTKRDPICVVCPNGEHWEIDRRSSNGDGWTVTGELPDIVVTPSIVVEGYHGWLGCNGAPPGTFSGDIEGRGPTGTARVIQERA